MSLSSALKFLEEIIKPPKISKENRYFVSEELLFPIKQLCHNSDEISYEISRHLDYSISKSKNFIVCSRCLIIFDILMPIEACRLFVNNHIKTMVNRFKSKPPLKNKHLFDEFQGKCKYYIELWDLSYHDSCPHISITRRYFEQSLKCTMPKLTEKAHIHNQQKIQTQQEDLNKALIRCRELLNGSIMSDLEDIHVSLDSLRSLLLILFPFDKNNMATVDPVITHSSIKDTSNSSNDANASYVNHDVVGLKVAREKLCIVDEDGEEIDFNDDEDEDEDKQKNSNSNKNGNINHCNHIYDDEDVDWEDELNFNVTDVPSPKRQKSGHINRANVLAELGSVPYAMELTVPTGVGVASDDNAAVLDNAREIARYLSMHTLKRLSIWRETLVQGLHFSSDWAGSSSGSSSGASNIIGNSTSSSSSSTLPTATIPITINTEVNKVSIITQSIASTFYVDPRKLQDVLKQVDELTEEVNIVLNSRYKELLFPY